MVGFFYPHALTLEFNPTEGASLLSVQGMKYATTGTGRAFGRGGLGGAYHMHPLCHLAGFPRHSIVSYILCPIF